MIDQIPLKVLLVDDDRNIAHTLSISLRDLQCDVTQASSPDKAVDKAVSLLQNETWDLILTDFRMGEKTGLDLIHEAKKLQPSVLVVVMTAFASVDNAVTVMKEGAFDYLTKPFTRQQLIHLLKKVRLVVSLNRENRELKATKIRRNYFAGFTSVASQRLESFIKKVAATEATVLLTGPSGTGKSELAHTIHELSHRTSQSFITLYCTTLTESLLESELFGHVKGAFTGATQDKVGKLELAQGGTLFLDEIGDLSLNGQAKLLRFLQERVFERVGSNQEISVNTRILAATNKNLNEAVAAGKFREDLYYRLNVMECVLPSLRHRQEDIPVFIERFLKELTSETLSLPAKIPEPIMLVLQNFNWPGNIRELRNVMERILMLSQGRAVHLSDLPDSILNQNRNQPFTPPEGQLFDLQEAEKRHIQYVLSQVDNLEKAAEILGVTTVTLWRKRKEYGLP